MSILDSTTTRLCLDTHPVALSYMLVQYATNWEETLKFLSVIAELQGIQLDAEEVARLIAEYYGD